VPAAGAGRRAVATAVLKEPKTAAERRRGKSAMDNINVEHPEYVARRAMMRRHRDLYAGGEQMREHAGEYLTRRQKEPMAVYHERLNRAFYENYIGSIIEWYAATLFRREPLVQVDGADESGRRFFGDLIEDADLRGTSITDFFRKQFIETLIHGASYTLVDFPRTWAPAASRADEDALGKSRAYLVGYTPEHLINWSFDDRGSFEWVVLRSSHLRKKSVECSDWLEETSWIYYDRSEYRLYKRRCAPGEDGAIEKVSSGPHGFAELAMVPMFEMRVPEGLWLMNKAGLLQLEHFNKSNALGWAITMSLFAMPVVYTERPWDQVMSESYYIQLGPQDRFGWTEPEGKVFQIAADNLTRLQEEIYRICYLMSQSGGMNSGAPMSGLSKLRDFAITQEVLRAYGDAVKDSMKRVLRATAAARQDELRIDVAGLDEFDIADFRTDLENAGQLLALGIESPTLKKQVFKRLAYKYLCDMRQEIKDSISAEIERV
jgi:hypothetical protein